MSVRQNPNVRQSDVVPISERRFQRFTRRVSWIAVALVVVVGCIVGLRTYRSHDYALSQMERQVSRNLNDALHSGHDIGPALETLDATAKTWRSVFKTWQQVPEREASRILALQTLQDRRMVEWRRMLASPEMDLGARENSVLGGILQEQQNWPEPPPPPVRFIIVTAFQQLYDGASLGIAWPYYIVGRVANIHRQKQSGSIGELPFGRTVHYIVFPYTLSGITPGGVLGFGVFVVAVGYFFCHIGMKINATLFSAIGLLYFLYALVYVLFLASLLLHLL